MANSRNCKLNQGDLISLLPDDILLRILSKLSIKEQTRTSVLSSRWINLWTNLWIVNSRLTIEAEDFVESEANNSQTKTLDFVNTADQILRMHKGQVIDQLKITCPDDPSVKTSDHFKVHSWIQIAKQKQVKALHLDFRLVTSQWRPAQEFSLGSTEFSSLVTLRLENTFLSDNVIHDILCNSPNLLELSIIKVYWLQHLNVSGSSLKLKHLELVGNYIFSIEISAPNLVSFSISSTGDSIWPAISFKNIPLLTQLSCSLGFILYAWRDFCAVLPQLTTLTLTLSKSFWVGDNCNFPVLTKLKHMHVIWLSKHDGLLPSLLELIRASPYLCRLSFDMETYTPERIKVIKNFANHKFLEELEIHNFNGFQYEVQLLICILKSCCSLKKVIIHPSAYIGEVRQRNVKSMVQKLTLQKGSQIVFQVANTSSF